MTMMLLKYMSEGTFRENQGRDVRNQEWLDYNYGYMQVNEELTTPMAAEVTDGNGGVT